ncbi:MAG: sigma-70 family RNA polymerase sigma factor [Thermoanaerobaculia bacterium]|nr:sigma-70 family RNA polymerase sigma factor [Thermoanaerobaculia bacterium]
MAASDSELVRRILSGSDTAAAELVHRYQRPVFSILLRMVRDRTAAEDLAQETFIKALNALDSFQQERKFSSWLFKIAHNRAIDHLRRASPESVPLETQDEALDPLAVLAAPEAERPDRAAGRLDLRRAFQQSLARLRPSYREVVVLRFQEGLSYEEIAEVCDLPMGTVKTHLHRARKALAKELTELGFGPGSEGGETA